MWFVITLLVIAALSVLTDVAGFVYTLLEGPVKVGAASYALAFLLNLFTVLGIIFILL